MNRPTIVIGGGYDKHVTFDDWIACFGDKVKWLVLLGQTANQIAETAKKLALPISYLPRSLEEAVQVCCRQGREWRRGSAVSGLRKLGHVR